MKPYYNIGKEMLPIINQGSWLSDQWIPTHLGCGKGMFWNWCFTQERIGRKP